MSPLESVELAVKNILSNKLRSLLTMLGIIIGVAAVTLIVGLGNGAKIYMVEGFKSLGTNTLTVNITGRGSSSRTISVDQMSNLVASNPKYLKKVSPTVRMTGSVKIGTQIPRSTVIMGVGEDYLDIKAYSLSEGRNIESSDIPDRSHYCVIGSYLASTYFTGDPVGQSLKVGGNYFDIVGVVSQEADGTSGSADDYIYIPYSTAARLSSTSTISTYVIEIVSVEQAAEATAIVNDALYNIFLSSNYYNVRSLAETMSTVTQMINIVVAVLSIVAGISLVVGGIGIMNIMLVSVTERTKEIGIRKALGAKERYILTQFVIEAATTSAIGGLIGIGFGYGLSAIATKVVTAALNVSLPVVPTAASVFMAFGISAAIGIVFGYLPARKAAKLNPIDALRNE